MKTVLFSKRLFLNLLQKVDFCKFFSKNTKLFSPFQRKKIVFTVASLPLFLICISFCSTDPLEKEINEALKNEDYLKAATVCAEYKGSRFKDQCLEAKSISEDEILNFISQKKEFPFMKLMLNSEKDLKIRELLKKDIYLGVKYRIIWNEISEKK